MNSYSNLPCAFDLINVFDEDDETYFRTSKQEFSDTQITPDFYPPTSKQEEPGSFDPIVCSSVVETDSSSCHHDIRDHGSFDAFDNPASFAAADVDSSIMCDITMPETLIFPDFESCRTGNATSTVVEPPHMIVPPCKSPATVQISPPLLTSTTSGVNGIYSLLIHLNSNAENKVQPSRFAFLPLPLESSSCWSNQSCGDVHSKRKSFEGECSVGKDKLGADDSGNTQTKKRARIESPCKLAPCIETSNCNIVISPSSEVEDLGSCANTMDENSMSTSVGTSSSSLSRSNRVAGTQAKGDPSQILPLRALSAYNFFFRDERERILHGGEPEWSVQRQDKLLAEHWNRDRSAKRQHRKSHGKISFTSLSKLISQRWNSLTEPQKDFYKEIAARDLERYHQELRELATSL